MSDLAEVVRIGDIHRADAGVQVREERHLVLEPVHLRVDVFRVLVRAESASAGAEVADRHLIRLDRHRVTFVRDVEHVRLALDGARFAFPAVLVGDEGVGAGQARAVEVRDRFVPNR
jgi:hypothetical protein